MMATRFVVRAEVEMAELQRLFTGAWGTPKPGYEGVLQHSFTWVAAREADALVGFVNVAWDGGTHFFLLDTTVDTHRQRRGIGTGLVRRACEACTGVGRWMHVDADAGLMASFYDRCGFQRTAAGLMRLDPSRRTDITNLHHSEGGDEQSRRRRLPVADPDSNASGPPWCLPSQQ